MNLLFVCSGNTCRSAMAAAVMDKIVTENDMDIYVDSAGLFAADGDKASENAVTAMARRGIDLSAHRSKRVTPELVKSADLVLTMTDIQKQIFEQMGYDLSNIFTLKEYLGIEGDIEDPYGGDEAVYDETADELYDLLVDAAEKIADKYGLT
ncbi:MAG: low molecular weight protein arginine phosphatase [Firmicutes bacterium]|nr:low molecular weight protein arginine phosphatase [Bacillota bacterium]